MADSGDVLRNRDTRQDAAILEDAVSDAGDVLRNRDTRQAAAAPEGEDADAGDAVGHRDARQLGADKEGPIPDAGDRITSNGVRNHQFPRGGFIAVGDADLAVCRGPGQPAKSNAFFHHEPIPYSTITAKILNELSRNDGFCADGGI